MAPGSKLRRVGGALTLLAFGLGCAPGRTDRVAPGVLVIAIDGLRADHLGVYGYDRDTSPTLGALAAEGVLFEEVFASAPQLLPAHAALLTGCEPSLARRFLTPEYDGASERRWHLPARVPRLAVEFLAAGYATAAFVEHELLDPGFGFDSGFQRYAVLAPESAQGWEGPQSTRVIEHFLKWLRSLPADQPWFAYLELHQLERRWTEGRFESEGFFPPRPELDRVPPVANTDSVYFAIPRSRWRGGARTLGQYEALYDDEIRRLDGELERLLASLRAAGRDAATSLHVVGSFGIQFGEAGRFLAAGRYSRADLGVPWIVRPRADMAVLARRVPGLVSSLDLAPTALALEGLDVPGTMHGRSQAAAVRQAEAPAAERSFVFASCGLQEGCAVIGAQHALEYLLPLGSGDAQLRRSWTGEWSPFALQPKLLFYDRARAADPPLEPGTGGAEEGALRPMRQAALEWLRDMSDLRAWFHAAPGRSGLDAEALRRLGEHGYLREAPGR